MWRAQEPIRIWNVLGVNGVFKKRQGDGGEIKKLPVFCSCPSGSQQSETPCLEKPISNRQKEGRKECFVWMRTRQVKTHREGERHMLPWRRVAIKIEMRKRENNHNKKETSWELICVFNRHHSFRYSIVFGGMTQFETPNSAQVTITTV